MEIVIAATTVMAISSFMLWTIRHLPVIDFRPYQVGNHLPTIMEDFEPDEVEYLYICEKEGVQETFTAANYPDSTWKLVSWEQKIIKKGYESPIHDFEIINANGDDLTLDILESSSPVRLVVMYDLSKADKSQMTKIEALLEEELAAKTLESVICDSIGAEEMMSDTTEYIEEDYEEVIPLSSVYILTGSGTEDIESFSIDYPHLAEYICTCDPVTLKTIVRANPGVIVLQNGIVIDKYNVRNR
jgi:hypothetical protein